MRLLLRLPRVGSEQPIPALQDLGIGGTAYVQKGNAHAYRKISISLVQPPTGERKA